MAAWPALCHVPGGNVLEFVSVAARNTDQCWRNEMLATPSGFPLENQPLYIVVTFASVHCTPLLPLQLVCLFVTQRFPSTLLSFFFFGNLSEYILKLFLLFTKGRVL